MSRRIAVTGLGALSSVADSPEALWPALAAGRSGLKPIELFALDGLPALLAGEIRPFDPKVYLGERNFRPVDRTSRLLLVAAQQALAASGWTAERRAASEVGLVLGTTFCSVRTIAEFDRRGQKLGPNYASPMDFANSVINAAAGQAAIWHDLRGVNTTVSCGEASGLAAIAYGVDALRREDAQALLCGGVEELCFESYVGHLRAGRLARGEEPPVPFDARRSGFALAEGAAALMLEREEAACEREARVLGWVLGHGSAFSPDLAAARLASGLSRAIGLALADAETAAEAIDCVFCGASGSVAGDRAEALGLAQVFGPRSLPVAAVKAQLGEALGASGALQAVAALGTLNGHGLPGVPGLEPDPELPLEGVAAFWRELAARRTLATAVSADGHCHAVVFAAT